MTLLWTLISSFDAMAVPGCGNRRQIAGPLFDVGDIYQKSSQTDDPDRKSAQDFGLAHGMSAGQVEKRYSATGDIICPNGAGQAQVTVKGDTVTTSAHMIYHGDDCKEIVPFRSCKFQLTIDGKKQEYKFKAILKSGRNCPNDLPLETADDWIVFRLEKAVDPRVKPYAIPGIGRGKAAPGDKIVTVAKSHDWPDVGRTLLRDRPRHYGECQLKKSSVHEIQSNCDTSAGSSGGSVLTTGEDPVLIGIVSGQINPKRNPNCEKRPDNTGAYQPDCWGSVAVAVGGDFRSAIMEATGLNDDAGQSNSNPAPPKGFKLPGMHL